MMAKWNWGGEENQGVGRIAASGDRAGGASPLSPQAVSTEGAHPLRGSRWRLAIVFVPATFGTGWLMLLHVTRALLTMIELASFRVLMAMIEWAARDSRSKPVRAETVEQGSVHESDGGEANRPENPAYFWLGIQAEGRE